MREHDLISIWKSSADKERITINEEKLMSELTINMKKFDKKVFYRDLREIIIAIIMLPIFVFIAYAIPMILSKVGAIILSLWCIYVIYYLRKNNKQNPNLDQLPNKEYLTEKRAFLLNQYNLVNGALYWYITPFCIGTLFFINGVDLPLGKSILFNGIIIAMSAVIYFMNKKAARVNIQPKIDEVDHLISELNK